MKNLRQQQLEDALASRILIIDGAMGTMLQALQSDCRPISAARRSKIATKI